MSNTQYIDDILHAPSEEVAAQLKISYPGVEVVVG